MKKVIFTIVSVLSFLFLFTTVKAGVSISSFTIKSQYLVGSQLRPNIGSTTPFVADFMIVKSGDTYNTVVVSLILRESSGTNTVLSSTAVSHFSGDWGSSPTWEGSISGTLPANKTSGNIYLQITVYEGDSQGATTNSVTSYSIYSGVTTPPQSNPFPVGDPRYIKPTQVFTAGTLNIARNGVYHLDFQGDGNLVLYKDGSDPVLWASDTNGKVGSNATLLFTDNGFVYIKNSQGSIVWEGKNNNPNSYPNCYWVMQTDGNFVGYQSYRTAADGSITSYGNPIGSTSTVGGVRSRTYGKL